MRMLLAAGADPLQRGYEGKTPAQWAEETGNPRVAALIRRAPTFAGRWMAAEQRLAAEALRVARRTAKPPSFVLREEAKQRVS